MCAWSEKIFDRFNGDLSEQAGKSQSGRRTSEAGSTQVEKWEVHTKPTEAKALESIQTLVTHEVNILVQERNQMGKVSKDFIKGRMNHLQSVLYTGENTKNMNHDFLAENMKNKFLAELESRKGLINDLKEKSATNDLITLAINITDTIGFVQKLQWSQDGWR